MIDAEGAVVLLDGSTRVLVEQAGYVDPQYYRLLPGAAYHHKRRRWLLPINVIKLQNGHDAAARTTPSGLQLRGYQNTGVEFIHNAVYGALIGFDVGLGKTLTVLQAISEDEALQTRPFLVVGPLLAAGAWVGDYADPAKHYGWSVVALRGKKPASPSGALHGVFCHYDILPAWVDWVNNVLRPAFVCFDESHILRTGRTKAYDALRAVTRKRSVVKRIGLSATPVVNNVADLQPQLDLVQPHAWGDWTAFLQRYADGHQTEYGWKAGEHETNVEELRARLDQTLIRFSRAEVRQELPPFYRHAVRLTEDALDAAELAAYRADEVRLLAALAGTAEGGAPQIELINALLQRLSAAKRPAALAQATNLAEMHARVFVVCWYKETATWLCRQLSKAGHYVLGPLHSGTSHPRRAKLLGELREVERAVVVGTLGTTGMSLNELARCSAGLTVDLWYVPAALIQAEGRLHREGQLAADVEWHYLVANDTADEILFGYLERKAATIAAVINDPSAATLCETLGGRNEEADMKSFLAEMAAIELEE